MWLDIGLATMFVYLSIRISSAIGYLQISLIGLSANLMAKRSLILLVFDDILLWK